MIDRQSRDIILEALRKYMNEEISAFEFDDILYEINSADKTVQEVISLLWHYYDDCKDHKIVADKETWDLFNRILLLLESDGELQICKKKRIWSIRNLIAGISLIPFIYIITRTGLGEHLFIFSIPFGIVSMLLSFFNAKSKFSLDATIAPFPSFTSLRLIRSIVPKFRKIRYPKELSKRRIRNAIWGNIIFIPSHALWLILGPVGLFFQIFPDREIETKIKIPEQNESANHLSAPLQAGSCS